MGACGSSYTEPEMEFVHVDSLYKAMVLTDETGPSSGYTIESYIDLSHDGEFSFSFGLNLIRTNGNNPTSNIFHKGNNSTEAGPAIYKHDSGVLQFDVTTQDDGNASIETSVALETDQYVHVALVVDDDIKVYLDSALDQEKVGVGPADASISGSDTDFYFSNPWNDPTDAVIKGLVFKDRA